MEDPRMDDAGRIALAAASVEPPDAADGWYTVGTRAGRSDALGLMRWMYRGQRHATAPSEYRVRLIGRKMGYAVDGRARG
jgi:hypothetical protein